VSRLIGPSEGSREVRYIDPTGVFKSKAGRTARFYTDAAATTLADILTYPGGVAYAGSAVTIDAYSMLPLIQFPDGVDTLYVVVDGGPAWPVYAREDDRLDVLSARTLNVKDYGAKGDGVTNDSAAFTAALAAAGTTKVVRVPSGTYVVTPGTISLAAGQVMVGESSSTTTIISSAGSKTGTGIVLAARTTVSGLFVRGYYAGIDSRDNTVKILECQLSYNEIGIDFTAAAYLIRVRGNQITFNDVGIVVRPIAEAYEMVISENIIDNNAGVGIALCTNSGGLVIENNSIEGNRNYTTNVGCGLLVKGTNMSRLKVDGNWFENNGSDPATAVDIFMLAPSGEPATGVALRTAIVGVLPADLQSLFSTGGANVGAVSITSNAFIFTKYNVVLSGYKSSITVSRNMFKGIKDKFNKHIFLNVQTGTSGIGGGRIAIDNNNANNSDDAAIDPQVSSGINNTIVYSDATLTDAVADTYTYNGKDLFQPLPATTTFAYTGGTVSYSIPKWATTLILEGIAGGGGGGSGARKPVGTASGGGGSGGGGGYNRIILPVSAVAGPLKVTVGAAGTPGASVTTDGTNGNVGTAGGTTTITDTTGAISYLRAGGGGAGAGGTTAGGVGGSSGVGGSPGGAGATGGATAVGGNGTFLAGGGAGGGGGGINASETVFAAGLGSYCTQGSSFGLSPADTTGLSHTPNTVAIGGSAGGGGSASATAAASPGAAGGTWGAAGGGGGASRDGNASGAGGAPTAGYATITAF
jgi:hypothetical protein